MAGLASGAEYPLMVVVLFMAGKAVGLELVFVEMARMAGLAFDRGMLVAERILSVPVMVKRNGFPVPVGVAVGAFLAE